MDVARSAPSGLNASCLIGKGCALIFRRVVPEPQVSDDDCPVGSAGCEALEARTEGERPDGCRVHERTTALATCGDVVHAHDASRRDRGETAPGAHRSRARPRGKRDPAEEAALGQVVDVDSLASHRDEAVAVGREADFVVATPLAEVAEEPQAPRQRPLERAKALDGGIAAVSLGGEEKAQPAVLRQDARRLGHEATRLGRETRIGLVVSRAHGENACDQRADQADRHDAEREPQAPVLADPLLGVVALGALVGIATLAPAVEELPLQRV